MPSNLMAQEPGPGSDQVTWTAATSDPNVKAINADVLGRVISRVTGQPLTAVLPDKILIPKPIWSLLALPPIPWPVTLPMIPRRYRPIKPWPIIYVSGMGKSLTQKGRNRLRRLTKLR
jgi:hypothetical protein